MKSISAWEGSLVLEKHINLQDIQETYIVTAPSGTGKTTLNRRLVSEFKKTAIATSLTTRERRTGEINGDHYWFVDKKTFLKDKEENKLLEWAEVFGKYYGTSIEEVSKRTNAGQKVILEIDVQGWSQVHKKLPHAKSIFILPPSMKSLWQRLTDRGTDSFTQQWRRFKTARRELDQAESYQYFIVNDKLELAYQDLVSIIQNNGQGKLSRASGLEHCHKLIEEWEHDSWFIDLKAKAKNLLED